MGAGDTETLEYRGPGMHLQDPRLLLGGVTALGAAQPTAPLCPQTTDGPHGHPVVLSGNTEAQITAAVCLGK